MKTNSSDEQKLKIKALTMKIRDFLNDIYIGEKTYTKITGKLINVIKILIVSSRKFLVDDCFTKASSIAYTVIVSLIPTLTVFLTFFSIFAGVGDKKEILFDKIKIFMLEHNIKLNIDPFVEALSSLIDNAGKIGGIGAVVMIFSATAVLRTLEKALNDVWLVKKQRALFLKIIYYWAALTLGPIMLIAGTTVATQLQLFFSSSNYKSAFVSDDHTLWVSGHKANIKYSRSSNLQFNTISIDKIDFENQTVHEYDGPSKSFRDTEYRVEESEYNKSEFTDIQFIGNRGWIVGLNGIILTTYDRGATWMLEKWGSFNFKSIHMMDTTRGFLAAENGYLLETGDGGASYQTIEFENFSSNLNSISFCNKSGIITGDRGAIIMTKDAGKTWELEYPGEAKRKKKPLNLNNAHFVNEKTIWIAGDDGLILYTNNAGKKWNALKFAEVNYHSIYFYNENNGYVGGERGTLIHTVNGGEKWSKISLPTPKINRLVSTNGSIIAAGDDGMIMKSDNNGKTWKGIQGGNLVGFFVNFFAPFFFIWLLFLLAFIVLPNIKVPFKPAAIGASFTGAVWVIFILLFIVYVKSFARGTVAVYGGLAAIPLFLLMVYASALIILYGAEIAYTLMHPQTYENLKKTFKDKKDLTVFHGIAILYAVYKNFESGKGASAFKDFMKITANNADEIDHFTQLFKKEGLLIQNEEGGYLPSTSSKQVVIADVIDLIHDTSLDIPSYSSSDALKKYFHDFFNNMKSSRKEIIGDVTLAKLIEEIN